MTHLYKVQKYFILIFILVISISFSQGEEKEEYLTDAEFTQLIAEIEGPRNYYEEKDKSIFLPISIILLVVVLLGSTIILIIRPYLNISTNWINPILVISAELMKIDGSVSKNEKARVKRYLYSEFTERVAKRKYQFFEESLKKKNSLILICNNLNETHLLEEKTEVLRFLIRIAISDKFLSNSEERFIEVIAKRIKVSMSVVKSIYAMHDYMTEENLNRKRTYSPSKYKRSRAFTILGLEETATQVEVKKSYRELVKIYHPDKLVNKGLSKRGLENAKLRFQEVKDAYELLNK